MRTHRPQLLFIGCVIGALAVSAMPSAAQMTDEQIAKYFGYDAPHPERLRHFRLGAVVGLNMKAKFSMGGDFSVSGNNPGETGVPGVDHVYDDGFVKVDASGNNDGLTWNWGYQNSDQHQSGSLLFHASDGFTANQSSSVDAGPQPGIEIAYGGNIVQIKSALFGWEFGFAWLPIEIEDRATSPATVTRTTHSFDVSGVEKFPDAPYQGTFKGPGALISDIAQLEGSDTLDGTLTGSRTLDVSLYSFRLGPTLHWELHPKIAVAVSAGGAVGIISGDLKFNEMILLSDGSTTKNKGSSSSTEIVYGGYVAGTLMYHAVEHGDFYIGIQYMPLTDSTFKGPGREARLNLTGGIYVSAGINWPF
jgi:hypothetical protein